MTSPANRFVDREHDLAWGSESSEGAGPPAVTLMNRLRSALVLRAWPILISVAMMGVGLWFLFDFAPVFLHHNNWDEGSDLWGIFRGAHFVAWGYLGGVYEPTNGVNAFPGMPILLAPVAMLSSSLHLTESYVPFFLIHPTAALLLQPVELLLAASVVFAADALARRLSVPAVNRRLLCIAVGAFAWPTAAIWGHAEDALAMTFAMYALIALLDGRVARCGWLLGLGILMQPLVGLLLPLVVGAAPAGRRLLTATRALCLSAFLTAVAFVGNPSGTYRSVVEQPTSPTVNHATPWLVFAPKVGSVGVPAANSVQSIVRDGHRRFTEVEASVHGQLLVAGGLGRILYLVVAIAIGLFVWRRPQNPERLVWLAGVVLGTRCFFEAVMTPYYLAPPLILLLVMASRSQFRRFAAAVVIALEVTVFAYFHLNPWAWWVPVTVGMAVLMGLVKPPDDVPVSSAPSCVDRELMPPQVGHEFELRILVDQETRT